MFDVQLPNVYYIQTEDTEVYWIIFFWAATVHAQGFSVSVRLVKKH